MQPEHFSQKKIGNKYESNFSLDLWITQHKKKKKLIEKKNFLEKKFSSQDYIIDIFFNISVSLNGAPDGKYDIYIKMRDKNKKQALIKKYTVTSFGKGKN